MGSFSPSHCSDQQVFELGSSYSLSADVSDADSVSGFSLFSVDLGSPAPVLNQEKPEADVSEIELMTERFARLLLGEDMSGGRKGVCTALAISNDIANLSASVFGKMWKLEPLAPEKKLLWRQEMDWVLCVSNFIIELIPSVQESPDGGKFEIMVTRPRSDLYVNLPALKKLDAMLLNVLDEFGDSEFYYVNRCPDDEDEMPIRASSSGRPSIRVEEKWWLPYPKVPPNGLSENARKRLRKSRDCVNQIHKASSAINNAVLADMEVPEAYLDGLPKSAKHYVGDVIYRCMTSDSFSPHRFLDYYLDESPEHATLEIANRVETAIHIWRRKCQRRAGHVKTAKSSLGGMVKGFVHDSRKYRRVMKGLVHDSQKYEILATRGEALLQSLRLRFPDLPHTNLDRSKIQHNKDVGKAILEGYSRGMESLSLNVMVLIDDLIYVDDAAKNRTLVTEPQCDWRRFGVTISKNKPLSRSYFSRTGTCRHSLGM